MKSMRKTLTKLSKHLNTSVSELYRRVKKYAAEKADPYTLAALLAVDTTKIYFYTLPPNTMSWPFLLLNVYNYRVLEKLVDKEPKVKAIILDAGVDKQWRKKCSSTPFDYSEDYWKLFWDAVHYTKRIAKERWLHLEVVIPDYPDDYTKEWRKEHCLWVDNYTNIDRTLENIFFILQQDKGIKWLLPAQGYENVPQSILLPLEVYTNHKLHKRFRIAIANLCTSKKATTIAETVELAREFCKECHFHIFGASIKAIEALIKSGTMRKGDSWDSAAWTYPRTSGMWSARTKKERIIFYKLYMKRVFAALATATNPSNII